MAIEQQPPLVLSLMLADNGSRDASTGKYSVLGTISVYRPLAFPGVIPMLCAYAALTDGHGETAVKLRLVDGEEARKALFELEMVIDFSDPVRVNEIMVLFPGLAFPEPGVYSLQLFGASQLLAERRLLVEQVEKPE
jgi:hypothetical protein